MTFDLLKRTFCLVFYTEKVFRTHVCKLFVTVSRLVFYFVGINWLDSVHMRACVLAKGLFFILFIFYSSVFLIYLVP